MKRGAHQAKAERTGISSCRTWLRRAGKLVAALVLVLLVLIGLMFGYGWLESQRFKAIRMEMTRTHVGPLLPDPDDRLRTRAMGLLGYLPALSELHGNGLRFVVMPSLRRNEFAMALALPPGSKWAEGVIIAFDQLSSVPLGDVYHFTMPIDEYTRLTSDVDRMTDSWPGDSSMWLDGEPAAFERVRGVNVTSGTGNNDHYRALGQLIYQAVSPYVPEAILSREGGW